MHTVFSSATKSHVPKICEFQVERFNLSVSLPLVWPGTSTQKIYKTSHFSGEEVEYSIDNFSGRYFVDGCLGGGVDISTGHSHLPTSEIRVISFNTRVDSTYREAGINSHRSSASITAISINATPAKFEWSYL